MRRRRLGQTADGRCAHRTTHLSSATGVSAGGTGVSKSAAASAGGTGVSKGAAASAGTGVLQGACTSTTASFARVAFTALAFTRVVRFVFFVALVARFATPLLVYWRSMWAAGALAMKFKACVQKTNLGVRKKVSLVIKICKNLSGGIKIVQNQDHVFAE